MESPEEFTGSNDQYSLILKRKRTKRHRPSSTSDGDGVYFTIPSPSTSSGEISIITNTEEDQDMANCLILLARGSGFQTQLENEEHEEEEEEEGKVVKFNRQSGKPGFYVYECKTCNRTFPSFQALGGHRASHKKPKSTVVEENRAKPEQGTKLANKEAKIHECSICGSEFSSGQALGGHMRRHRVAPPQPPTTTDSNATDQSNEQGGNHDDDKKRIVLPLDLNLPAPVDDDHHIEISKFQFDRSKQGLVFSSPALVDCRY